VPLSYADAGVNIDAGNELVQRIKPHVRQTHGPQVLGGLGGFAALYALDIQQYKQPLLVSATDGVGTKLRLAIDWQQHDTIGIDLVAMCVNDLIVCGATPLFFLDYYATAALNVDIAETVIKGIVEGCKQAGAALVGGETAEMPGMYQPNDYDLAGFCVGVVDKNKLIDASRVKVGDVLLGVASSGPHANGYSLIRKILNNANVDSTFKIAGQSIQSALLAPTKIYVKSILELINTVDVHALAHITGGGFTENLPRVLPEYCEAQIDCAAWQRPGIFNWLQSQANIEDSEMLRTFNCGIGMVLCVSQNDRLGRCIINWFGCRCHHLYSLFRFCSWFNRRINCSILAIQ